MQEHRARSHHCCQVLTDRRGVKPSQGVTLTDLTPEPQQRCKAWRASTQQLPTRGEQRTVRYRLSQTTSLSVTRSLPYKDTHGHDHT